MLYCYIDSRPGKFALQDQHSHDHDHGGHGHGHAHDPNLVVPAFSLLRLSAIDRLAGAALVSALVWAGVWWSMR
ncbi:MAG: hypothetical protein KGM42_04455 [Hyphomicrobiales bacterium]|nr:hypothetical protein [Hyphomicrobiales bacterium]